MLGTIVLEQESQDRTTGAGKPGQNSWTGQLEKTVGTVETTWGREDRTTMTARTEKLGQDDHDSKDRTVRIVQPGWITLAGQSG